VMKIGSESMGLQSLREWSYSKLSPAEAPENS
jgi:hypothetical protein